MTTATVFGIQGAPSSGLPTIKTKGSLSRLIQNSGFYYPLAITSASEEWSDECRPELFALRDIRCRLDRFLVLHLPLLLGDLRSPGPGRGNVSTCLK